MVTVSLAHTIVQPVLIDSQIFLSCDNFFSQTLFATFKMTKVILVFIMCASDSS